MFDYIHYDMLCGDDNDGLFNGCYWNVAYGPTCFTIEIWNKTIS